MNVSFTSSHQPSFHTSDNNRLELRHSLPPQAERKSIDKPQHLEMDEESKKEAQEDKKEQYTHQTAEEYKQSLITYTMHNIVSANNQLKNPEITKMEQITLGSEAKGWENTNPSRSTALREKAEGLNEEIMAIASNINECISKAVNKEPTIIDGDEPKDEKESSIEVGRVWTEQELNAYVNSAKDEAKIAGVKIIIAV